MGLCFHPALSDGVFRRRKAGPVDQELQCLPYPLRGDRSRRRRCRDGVRPSGAFPNGFKSAAADLKAQYKQQDGWEENRLATSRSPGLVKSCSLRATGGRRRAANPAPRAPICWRSAMSRVLTDTWVEDRRRPAGARPGDVDWPQPDEVFVSVTPPEGGDESLTLAESRV